MIEKHILEKLYFKENKSTYEIAKELNVHRSTIGKALKRFGFKTRYSKLKEEVSGRKLNDLQKDFLIGSLLGDGCIQKHGKRTPVYITSHSWKQKEYIEWVDIFGNLASNISRQKAHNKKYNKEYIFYNFRTLAIPELNYYKDIFYKNGHKIIPDDVENLLVKNISIAVWIMEDGTFNKRNKSIYLCTDCFKYDENMKLCEVLHNNFGLHAKTVKYGKSFRIRFGANEYNKIYSIVSPYIIDSMRYKIDLL
jgi:hypothetical protein